MAIPRQRIKQLRAIFARYQRQEQQQSRRLVRGGVTEPGAGRLKSMFQTRQLVAGFHRKVRSYLKGRVGPPPNWTTRTHLDARIQQFEDRFRKIKLPKSRAKLDKTIRAMYMLKDSQN